MMPNKLWFNYKTCADVKKKGLKQIKVSPKNGLGAGGGGGQLAKNYLYLTFLLAFPSTVKQLWIMI